MLKSSCTRCYFIILTQRVLLFFFVVNYKKHTAKDAKYVKSKKEYNLSRYNKYFHNTFTLLG